MTAPATTRRTASTAWLIRRLRLPAALLVVVAIVHVSGCMERLFYYPQAGATPLPGEFPQAQEVWFSSADGTRLYGWFIPAMNRHGNASPAPTILHVHGNAGNITSHIWFTEYLPAAGFNLFIFDFRGYGQSEGSARRRKPLIEDTHAALDAILSRSDVDPSRIGVYGQSLGGSIALNVMAERKEIRAGVMESPFASWRSIAASALGGATPNALCKLVAAVLIPDSCSPLDAIARVDQPTLLLHGARDSIVPVEHSRQLLAAARKHGRNVTLIELAGGEHNSLRESHPDVEQTVVQFFQRTLAADAQ